MWGGDPGEEKIQKDYGLARAAGLRCGKLTGALKGYNCSSELMCPETVAKDTEQQLLL